MSSEVIQVSVKVLTLGSSTLHKFYPLRGKECSRFAAMPFDGVWWLTPCLFTPAVRRADGRVTTRLAMTYCIIERCRAPRSYSANSWHWVLSQLLLQRTLRSRCRDLCHPWPSPPLHHRNPTCQRRYLRAILIKLNKYSSCIWSLSVLTSSQTHWSVPSKQIVLKAQRYTRHTRTMINVTKHLIVSHFYYK